MQDVVLRIKNLVFRNTEKDNRNRRFAEREPSVPLVVMHVPKCAGTSLRNSLIDCLAPGSTLGGFDECGYGGFREFHTLHPQVQDSIHHGRLAAGAFDLVCGHISASSLRTRFPGAPLMTVLREPRIRLVSFFLHWRSHEEEELALWGQYADRIRLSHGRFVDFVHSREIAGWTDNLLTRFLLWPHPEIPDDDFIDQRRHKRLFEEAKASLHEFDFVDILENARLESNISAWLGRPFSLRKDHETKPRHDLRTDLSREFDNRADRQVERLTAIDNRLWSFCAGRMGLSCDARSADHRFSIYKERVTRLWSPINEAETRPSPDARKVTN